MPQRVSMPCPNCGRVLLIPYQNLGRGGRCRHCGHLFRAPLPSDCDLMLSSSTAPAPVWEDQAAQHDEPHRGLFRGVARVGGRLVEKVGEQAGKLPRINPRRWLLLRRRRGPPLQDQVNPAPVPDQRTLELKPDCAGDRGTIDALRSELAAIREQADQANRLKQELQADLTAIEQIRVQLKEAYPLAIDPNSQAALKKIQELEALRAEGARLREEAGVLRSQLEIQAAEAREKWNHLSEERDAACAERDRWKSQRAALECELEQARDLLGAERDALGREVEQLQDRLGNLERSQDEAGAQHERERAGWEHQRRELEEGWERQRRALVEAEDRLAEQRAGFEAERGSWRHQLNEQARRTAEAAARLGQVEQLQERTGRERDALTRRVDQLQGQLAISERRRAASESERDQERAAWEAQRRDQQAQWEHQLHELLAEAEQRIKEQQAGFEAERRGWDQQLEEHAEMAAVWESLAQEVEQVQAGLVQDREALTRELGQLRDQWAASEKSRTAAEGEFHEARARWEAERQELGARWEQQRQEIRADAERRLAAERDRLQAERQTRRQQADEQARIAAEAAARLGQVEQLQEQTGRERDALRQRVEQLQGQLATSERRRAASELERSQERATWEAQRRELQAQWEQQRHDLFAQAREPVDREHSEEHGRLIAERDALAREVEQLRGRCDALERSRTQGESEPDEARARWEAERQELEARWEQHRQEIRADAECRLAVLRDQLEAERQARRQQAELGCAFETLREEAATLQGALDGTRRERDAALQQVEAIGPERDRLRALRDQAEAAHRVSERDRRAERDRLVAALEQARQAAEDGARRGAEQDEGIRALRAELQRQRTDREALEAETRRNRVALQREWEKERQCWLELLGAGRPEALRDGFVARKDRASFPPQDWVQRSAAALRSQDATVGEAAASIPPVSGPSKREERPLRRLGVATALRPRPQASSYDDPETLRTHLEHWLAEARAGLRSMSANPGRLAHPAFAQWLEYEIKTAREEIVLLVQELAPSPSDPAQSDPGQEENHVGQA